MNYSKSNIEFIEANNNQASTSDRRVWLWLKKFWQFSCFYGDYLASLHAKK